MHKKKKIAYKSKIIISGVILLSFIVGIYLGGSSGPGSPSPGSSSPGSSSVELRIPPGGETEPTLSPALFNGKIARAYKVAKEIPEVLDKVWCYCDCENHADHKSLKTCYTSEHASFCGICMDEALMVYDLHKKGFPIDDIRKEVHREFS